MFWMLQTIFKVRLTAVNKDSGRWLCGNALHDNVNTRTTEIPQRTRILEKTKFTILHNIETESL